MLAIQRPTNNFKLLLFNFARLRFCSMQEPNTKTTHFKVDFSFGHLSLIYDELTIKHSDMIVIIPHRSSDDGDKYGCR